MRKELQKILDNCFAQLSKTDEVCLNESFLNSHHRYVQAWTINTTISLNNSIAEDISFIIAFKETFPYTIPDIYYLDTRYDYFPHIDYNNRKLCLFEDDIVFHTEEPYKLIRCAIKQAKKIIINGSELNPRAFLDEITSYWELKYNNEPELGPLLHTVNIGNKTRRLKLCTSNYLIEHRCAGCIVESPQCEQPEYISYIKSLDKNSFSEKEVLFLAGVAIPSIPPYNLTTELFLSWIITLEDKKEFRRYIETTNETPIIVFRLANTNLLGGIKYQTIKTDRRGFRKNSFSKYDIITRIEKSRPLQRLMISEYSATRIALRTKGIIEKHYKIAVAGLGSIGSHLCQLLNSFNNPTFTLIDSDFLLVDNLGRHLLGFTHLNQNKAEGMQSYLKAVNPNQKVSTCTTTIEQYIINNIDRLNGLDCLFICTGNLMSELYVYEKIETKDLTIPVFILWLGPYSIAGHMIYIGNNNQFSHKKIYHSDTFLYKGNIIDDNEYLTKSFTKKDAGCNGEYALYSANDVLLFLSAMYPIINQLLKSKKPYCSAYRWIGNLQTAQDKKIILKNEHLKSYEIEEIPIQ